MFDRLEREVHWPGNAAHDTPERHRALADTFEWSHRLLEPAPQALVRRGFTLEAARGVG